MIDSTDHESAQVQRCRPFWLTEPCPAWCTEQHRDGERAQYRHHYSKSFSIPLLLLDPVEPWANGDGWTPAALEFSLEQHVTEATPRVHVSRGCSTFDLTLGEASAAISRLQQLVDRARSG